MFWVGGARVSSDGTALISAWPSWLSPIGWGQQVRAFQHDRWWVVVLFLAATAVLTAIASRLSVSRDVGAGLASTRRGRADAPASLRGVFELAWRLQRGTLAAWAVGLSIIGASFGAIGESVDELIANNDQLAQMLTTLAPGGSLTDTFFAFALSLIGIAVGGFVVQATLRMRSEEASGRLESILATATARPRWMYSHLVIASAGAVALLAAVGASVGLAYVAATRRRGLRDPADHRRRARAGPRGARARRVRRRRVRVRATLGVGHRVGIGGLHPRDRPVGCRLRPARRRDRPVAV